MPLSGADYWIFIGYLAALGLLAGALLFAVKVKEAERSTQREG